MNLGRRPLILSVVFLGVTICAALAASPTLLASYTEQKLIALAKSGPMAVDPEGFSFGISGLKARRVRLFYAKYLTGFDLSEVTLRPSWAGILALKLPLNLSASAYSGEVKANFDVTLSGSMAGGSATVRSVDLSQHPQLQGLGIATGKISADIRQLKAIANRLPEFSLGLDLSDLSIPRSTVLPAELTGQSLLIPRISHLSLSLSGESTNNIITLSKLALSSQFGEASGAGTVSFGPKNTPEQYDLSFKLKPSEEGQSLITLLKSVLPSPRSSAASPGPDGYWLLSIKGGARPHVELEPA